MFGKKKWSDAKLIEALRSGGIECHRAIDHLRKDNEVKITALVRKYGGDKDQAMEVLLDGISDLWRNIVRDVFRAHSSLQTYLYSICKNRLRNMLRKKEKLDFVEELESLKDPSVIETETPESSFLSAAQREILNMLLQQLSDNCETLYRMFSQGYSMKEIAKALGYKSAEVAANKKHLCYQDLHKRIDKNPSLQQLIDEMGWKKYRRK